MVKNVPKICMALLLSILWLIWAIMLLVLTVGWTSNPNGPPENTGLSFVLATGFLALFYAVLLGADSIVNAIRSSPDATAEALRRGVKPKGP
jgi:hypothetical protein